MEKHKYTVTVEKNHYSVVWPGCKHIDSWRATGYEIDVHALRFFADKIMFLRKEVYVYEKDRMRL